MATYYPSREEKAEIVRDLYFNKESYHQIAKQARISLRDIRGILNRDMEGGQGEKSISKAAQAYNLFSKDNPQWRLQLL